MSPLEGSWSSETLTLLVKTNSNETHKYSAVFLLYFMLMYILQSLDYMVITV